MLLTRVDRVDAAADTLVAVAGSAGMGKDGGKGRADSGRGKGRGKGKGRGQQVHLRRPAGAQSRSRTRPARAVVSTPGALSVQADVAVVPAHAAGSPVGIAQFLTDTGRGSASAGRFDRMANSVVTNKDEYMSREEFVCHLVSTRDITMAQASAVAQTHITWSSIATSGSLRHPLPCSTVPFHTTSCHAMPYMT